MNAQHHAALYAIRQKHYKIEKQQKFNHWVQMHQEHLENMYQICLRYYDMPYVDFVNMIYVCSY